MSDPVHQVPAPDVRREAGEFRMTLRLPPDAAEALRLLAPAGERCDLIAYLLRCEMKRQGLSEAA